MSASDDQLIAAAAQAVESGMQVAQQHWQAAAANPGVGAEVRLPSYPIPSIRRPVTGLGYDTPGEPAPAPGNPAFKLTPSYASDVVGGAVHPAGSPAARTQWPAGTTVTVLPGARSSLAYIPASTAHQSWLERLATTIKRVLGR
jgi:hypothetical protein